MNEFYTRLEKDLIGIDGGNITAPLWLSGLEWGTSDEGIIDCVTRPTYENADYIVPFLSSKWKSENSSLYKWQFDQKIAKILCHVFDYEGTYKEYMEKNYCDKESNEFKLNLFPLSAANMDEWTEKHINITQTKIKYHYKTYCSMFRFKLLHDLAIKFKPKVIVCFGPGHVEEFKMAFWGKNHPSSQTKIEKMISDKNKLQILITENLPTLIIAPFLGRNS